MERGKMVMKSKSSNTAMSNKTNPKKNQKGWSSAKTLVQEVGSKKRGVYVEKKSTINALNTTGQSPIQISPVPKPQKRPRKGETTFLNNVLNILSQDTTATQFPEYSMLKTKHRRVRRRNDVATIDKGTQDLDAMVATNRRDSPVKAMSPPRRPPVAKRRFRSRILNNNNKQNEVVVLQHSKYLDTTSSTSQRRSTSGDRINKAILDGKQWLDLPTLKKQEAEQCELSDSPLNRHTDQGRESHNNEDMTSSVNAHPDDKRSKKGKVLRIEEPATLVGGYEQKPAANAKSLYNLLVDLIEKTIDDESDDLTKKKSISSKLQIDESVAKRLDIKEKKSIQHVKKDRYEEPDRNIRFYSMTEDNTTDKIQVYKTRPNCKNLNPPYIKVPRDYMYRRPYRNITRSPTFGYSHLYRTDPASAYSQSVEMAPRKKSLKKKNRKPTLLNMLKEQLQMSRDDFEEPQTLHQALKIISRNKQRCHRAIHFDEENIKRTKEDGAHECMFKRRRIISSSTKSNKYPRKYQNDITFMKSIKTSVLPRQFSTTEYNTKPPEYYESMYENISYHSIEVNGYDFEPNQIIRRIDDRNKAIVYASHSMDSVKTESISFKSETNKTLVDDMNKKFLQHLADLNMGTGNDSNCTIESSKDFIGCDQCETGDKEDCCPSICSSIVSSTSISQLLLKDTLIDMY